MHKTVPLLTFWPPHARNDRLSLQTPGDAMEIARAARITGFVLLLFLVLLALFCAIGLPAATRGWPPEVLATLVVTTSLVRIAYFVALFFAIPHGLLLRRLQVKNRWAIFVVGVLSGWFFLMTVVLSFDWFTTAAHSRNIGDAASAFLSVFVSRPGSVVHAVWWASGVPGLAGSGLIAAVFMFLWQMAIYRLPTDQGRDWEPRILGRQPPYDGV